MNINSKNAFMLLFHCPCRKTLIETNVMMEWPHRAIGTKKHVYAQKKAVRTLGHQQGLITQEKWTLWTLQPAR